MISLNEKEITQIYRDDSLVEYIYKGDRPIYDCMIDYVLNDDGTCYVNRAGQTNVARQENIEYLYIPNKICKNSRIYEVTQVGTRDGYNNKFRILKKALIGAPTDESGKMTIVDYGFEDRTSLEEVVITDSVSSIGKGAFLGCNKIAKMTLPPCASRLDRIFGNQRNDSTGEWAPKSLKTVTIHSNRETFKRLQERFFYKCSYITTVNIDIKNFESIGDYAFEGCSNLTNITIPDSVTSIGVGVFSGCDTLKYNEYNNGHYLGNDNNPYVALIKAKNTSISSCIINKDTKVICPDAFEGCDNLQYNEYDNGYYLGDSNNQHVALIKAKNTSISSCTINENTKIICPYAFRVCSGLTSVTIGNSVTSIGEGAFKNCSSLTSITIPNSVTSIGVGAFSDCDSLTSVEIGNSVTSISESAFYNCSDLTDVTIGNSVTSIGGGAFYGCNGLQSIYYTGDVASWCGIEGLGNVTSYSRALYIGGKKVEGDLVIPDSVTSIGSSAFYNCSGLTSVTIPDSVTSIGSSAFSYCGGLTSIKIPNSVTYIDSGVFAYSGLTSVTIGNSVTYIGNYAFHYCGGLKSIKIPDSVTCIDSWAFAYSGLTSVTIPDSVTSMGDSAFSGCDGLTSATIGNSVTSISSRAFSDCSGLTNVKIPDSVTSIGQRAFFYCSKLTDITIPNSVTSIGYWAFGSSGLTSIKIPDSVTSIGKFAFLSCSSLTSVTIGSSVTSIGERAFDDCSGLTSVTMLPTNPPTLGSGAIPSNVTTITVPVGCGNTYKTAAVWSAYADKIVEAAA